MRPAPGLQKDFFGGLAVGEKERGGAAGAVAGHLGTAAIGIKDFEGCVVAGFDNDPAIGSDAGVAVADGAGESGEAVGRDVLAPGEEEIVLGAVGFGEGDVGHG